MIKDKLLRKSIEELGFTKVSLGDKKMIHDLRSVYNEYYSLKTREHDMSVTHNTPGDQQNFTVHKKIKDIVEPYFNKVFEDYKFLASHFVVKKSKSNEAFQIHQDWNVVDERKYVNHQVWIPLSASYPENGGICFIPESHNFFKNIRSGSLGISHIPILKDLHPYLSYLRLFPGEAAVFYSKTFHGSFINSTPENRLAVLVNIVESKAQPVYFHKNESDDALAYPVTSQEIFEHLPELEKGKLPLHSKSSFVISSKKQDSNDISSEDLFNKIHESNKSKNRAQNYEHKLFHIFKDLKLEAELNDKGYVIIDLLDELTIKALKDKFNKTFPKRSMFKGTFSSMSLKTKEEKKAVHNFIVEQIHNNLEKYFKDFVVPSSLFYSRKPDSEYPLEWHSDPSLLLNEHLEPLYGVWSPLYDVSNKNGALKVIPGSHRLLNKINYAYKIAKWPLEDKRSMLEKYQKTFQLKAGQAIVFDARIVHSSDPNKSSTYRDNIVMRVNHKQSNYFNVMTPSSNAEKGTLFKQKSDYFFTETNIHHDIAPETGTEEGTIYLFYNDISEQYIDEKLKKY